jgi:NADPH:quinone reductase-like Zn-dependent oxidoreductase
MKALILDAERETAALKDIAIPNLSPNELLIHVHSVALNPVDALYVSHPLGSTGRVVGSDFAGTVVSSHSAIPSHCHIQKGSRVAGFLQGACSINERPGAFAEYLVCPWDLVWEVPEDMTFDEAATISLCGLTAAQAIYYRLGLRAPFWDGETSRLASGPAGQADFNLLIFSASTSVAMYAAQLVRHSAEASGVKVKLFGTASAKRFEMLREKPYSYDYLVDYHDVRWFEEVLQLSGGRGMQYALDCISEGDSVKQVVRTLSKDGQVAIVRSREGGAWDADDVLIEPKYGAVWEGLGAEIQYQGMIVPASPDARDFAVKFYNWISKVRKLEPNPIRKMPGGLERVVDDGFTLLGTGAMQDREQKREEPWMKPIGAEKLVYRIG